MKNIKLFIFSVFCATLWIGFSEFLRNEILFKSLWIEHYRQLGLVFPSATINNFMWGIWSLMFAIAIYIISRKFSFWETVFLSWFVGFVMMWVVIGNLGVLPFSLLLVVIPLSVLETTLSVGIVWKISNVFVSKK